MSDLADNNVAGNYADPVRQLLALGESRLATRDKWPDYPARFGLEDQHIGALIRLACDPALPDADPDSAEVWAPVHAWRALGQLRAEASVAPLLALLATLEEDETADADLPVVFGMIGPAALPLLAGFLADRANPSGVVTKAMYGIKEIGEQNPECRDECVGILVRMLDPDGHIDRDARGFAVCALIDLAAVEAIDAIRDAFRREAVEISIPGDLEDVEIALGLRTQRVTPRPRYSILPDGWSPRDADRFRPAIETLPKRQAVGRNDPCPCGSGKKYKKCCL